MKVKEESEKAGLKLSIQEIKSCHLVPHFKSYWWRYNGIQDSFNFLDFQHHCGQWLKPWMCKTLAPWMKSYDQCGHRLKSRVITDKDPNSQSYGFSRSHLWSWEMDNTRTECQITEALQLSGLRILLTVLWTAEVSNNSIMKEINWDSSRRERSWMWRASSLAIWGQEPNHWERPWSWERFSAGKEGNQRGQFSSVQFSHSVMSNTLWFHGLQHIRSLCPSPTRRIYSNSCPLSQWCHQTISSSVISLSSHFESFPASGSFLESVLCIRWPKDWSFSSYISPSNEYSGLISFRMDWLDLLAVQGTLKNLLQHHS